MAEATVTYLHPNEARHRLEEASGLWWGAFVNYRVVGEGRSLGVVGGVERTCGAPSPDILVIESGLLRRRRLRVPIDDVAFADPYGKRLYLEPRYRTVD